MRFLEQKRILITSNNNWSNLHCCIFLQQCKSRQTNLIVHQGLLFIYFIFLRERFIYSFACLFSFLNFIVIRSLNIRCMLQKFQMHNTLLLTKSTMLCSRSLEVIHLTWIFPGRGNGNPLQYFAWKIPWMEEPGRLQVHGVAKSQTRLSNFTFTFVHGHLFPHLSYCE